MAVIWTHLSRRLARTHHTRTLYAGDAEGGGHSSTISRKMLANRSRGMATFTLWRSIASLADQPTNDRSWREPEARERACRSRNVGRSRRAPGAGLLSLAFFVITGLWTKARGFPAVIAAGRLNCGYGDR